MVVLSLSSVPEATCSHVHDKNMHMLLACSRTIFFLPIILFSFSLICIFLIAFLLSLASASVVILNLKLMHHFNITAEVL